MGIKNIAYSIGKRGFRIVYHSASRLGERLGVEWLTYNYGVFLAFRRSGQKFEPGLSDVVMAEFPDIKSLCDVGCGPGVYAATFQAKGLRVAGCEYSAQARRWVNREGVEVYPFDLSKSTEPLPGVPYDLAICLEVAEHVPPHLSDVLVEYISRCSDHAVFTAAFPGQGGTGHVNEQPQSYWIEKFAARAYGHDAAMSRRVSEELEYRDSASFLIDSMMIFHKEGA